MKTISTLALAAAIAYAGGAAPTAPAFAKDKAPAGPQLSQAVVRAAQAADTALGTNDVATAEPLVAQVETAAGNDYEKYVAAALRYRLEAARLTAQQTTNPGAPLNQTALAKPLDALIANPSTPAAEKARYAYQRGQLAYFSKQYPVAIEYIGRARELGYANPDLDLTLARARIDGGDVAGGAAELDRVVAAQAAKGQKAPPDYFRFAVARASRSNAPGLAVAWLNKYAATYPTGPTWYEVLTTYGLEQGATAKLDDPQKVDVLRLLRAAGGLADQYYYLDYARRAQSAGLPLEAQAVLKEGIATGKIPTADPQVKALQVQLTAATRTLGTPAALEAKAKAAATGQAAAQAGDAYLSSAAYAKAAAMYQAALQKGGVDADAVNTHLGIALARSGDKAGAQAAFAAVKGAPRADIAGFWTTWLNTSAA